MSYHIWLYPDGPIYDFVYERDSADILNLFKTDAYWLYASPDFSPEYTLQYRAPSYDPRYLGSLKIKVMRKNGGFVGFVGYYLEKVHVGRILFIAVQSLYRGKGYGHQLLSYAVNDLIRLGAQKINLLTRTTNIPAQTLYTHFGFEETVRDHAGYVYYHYVPTFS